jgi:hypothetical protein
VPIFIAELVTFHKRTVVKCLSLLWSFLEETLFNIISYSLVNEFGLLQRDSIGLYIDNSRNHT